eukprot:4114411-Pyramimonas_sp.AAC.1
MTAWRSDASSLRHRLRGLARRRRREAVLELGRQLATPGDLVSCELQAEVDPLSVIMRHPA